MTRATSADGARNRTPSPDTMQHAAALPLRSLARLGAAAAPPRARRVTPRLGAAATRAQASSSVPTVKLLGVCGSLRAPSVNAGLLRAAAAQLPPGVTLEVVVPHLPLYDGDLEAKGVPAAVEAFRAQVAAADGVLFACPEYNGSVSGPLKNAIDWASRSPNVWDNKPVAMMGAGGGSGTAKAQLHLREIAVVVNALMLNKTVQVQAFTPGNCDLATGELVSADARKRVADLVAALAAWVIRLAPK